MGKSGTFTASPAGEVFCFSLVNRPLPMNNFRVIFRIQPVDFTIFYGILQFLTEEGGSLCDAQPGTFFEENEADNEIRPETIRYGAALLRPAVGGGGRFCLQNPEKIGEAAPPVSAGAYPDRQRLARLAVVPRHPPQPRVRGQDPLRLRAGSQQHPRYRQAVHGGCP